jgi:hypothetical protein
MARSFLHYEFSTPSDIVFLCTINYLGVFMEKYGSSPEFEITERIVELENKRIKTASEDEELEALRVALRDLESASEF